MGIPIESTNFKRALRQIRQDASHAYQENSAILEQFDSSVLSLEEACDLAERAFLVVIACGGLTCASEWAAVTAIVKLRQAREASNGS